MFKIPIAFISGITSSVNEQPKIIEIKDNNINPYINNSLDEYIKKYDDVVYFEEGKFKIENVNINDEDTKWLTETIDIANENLPDSYIIIDGKITSNSMDVGEGSTPSNTDAPSTCLINGVKLSNYHPSGYTAESTSWEWWGSTIEKKLNSCDTAKYVFGDTEKIFIDQGWRDYFYNNPDKADEYSEMIGTTVGIASEISIALSTGGSAPHGFGLVAGSLSSWSFNEIFNNLDIIGDSGWGTLRNYMWSQDKVSLLSTDVLDLTNNYFNRGIKVTGKDGWIPGDAEAYGPFLQ